MHGKVSTLTYHFVWCPNYCGKILTGAIVERLSILFHERAAARYLGVVALDVAPDRVHVCAQAPSTRASHHSANRLKGCTARVLRDEFPWLRSRLPSSWSRSSYKTSTVSLWTPGGRRTIPFVCGERQRALLAHRAGESDLVHIRSEWYVLAMAEVAAENEQPVTDVPGIDLDVTNIATDSDGVGALVPDAGPKKLE